MLSLRAGIALGSNLGDRLAHLQTARSAVLGLRSVGGPCLNSPVYETSPVGTSPDAPFFLNAVIEVEYDGQPLALLEGLQGVELALGRPSKRPRNASRTIDLDLLYLGNLVLANEEVIIPHPRLHQRRFVLAPLADIRPGLVLPGHQESIGELLAQSRDPAHVQRIAEAW